MKLTAEALKPDVNFSSYAPIIWLAGYKGYPMMYSQVCGMGAARDKPFILDDVVKGDGVSTRLDLYQ